MTDRAIYYAVTNDRRYCGMARESIESVRRYDKVTDVYLFVYGGGRRQVPGTFARQFGVKLSYEPPLVGLNPTFLKWLPLGKIPAQSALFLDADTYAFGDIRSLFRRYASRAFYARREYGTERSLVGVRFADGIVKRYFDRSAHRDVARDIGVRCMPIFNSGVMLFNRGLHKQVSLPLMSELFDLFTMRPELYPCKHFHIVEEVVASHALGAIEGATYGFMEREWSPWALDWIKLGLRKRGRVVHTFSSFYDPFMAVVRASPPGESEASFLRRARSIPV